MAKYDCSKTKDFMYELKRALEWCRKRSASECEECELCCKNGICVVSLVCNLDCISERQFDYVIQMVQNWSDSHPEKRELTENERDILKAYKALGYTYIAADSIGCVRAYTSKPQKSERMWSNISINCEVSNVCKIEKFFGGIVSWEDEEPAEIEDLLKKWEEKSND